MIWLIVHNKMRVDETRDDVEWWPHIIAMSQERRPRALPFATGATKTAELAWDLIEALHGHPAPGRAYRIAISAADPDLYDSDFMEDADEL